jgi:hypothetical protein
MNIFENWQETKTVIMDGLTAKQQEMISPLLENQKNYLLNETASAGSVDAHSIAGFRKVLIPMIRRIIPGTIASELVGVQPMSGPVGLVYSLRFKYNDAVARAGSPTNIAAGDELFGNTTALGRFYSGGTDTAQRAGAGGFDELLDVSDAQDGSVLAGPGAVAGVPSGDAWGSSLDINSTTAHRSFGGSGSFAEGTGGRQISLEITSQAVEAGSRKLQSGWTIEAMQDLNSQHGLDIESEMTQAMSAEIVQEIDAEIIGDLLALAGTVRTFSGAVPGAPGFYQPAFVGDRFANLGVQINAVANEIARKTRRGAGNFIVVSPMIVSLLQSAAKSVFAPAIEGSFKGPNNTQLVGTLNGTIKVYSYLWNQSTPTDSIPAGTGNDSILVGYKGGNGETDSGYFYCPYIPLMSSGVVMNPVTFQPSISLLTRYGKTTFTDTNTSLGNSADYYGKINVTALSFS